MLRQAIDRLKEWRPVNQSADRTSGSGASPDLDAPSQDPELPEHVRGPGRRQRQKRRLTRRGRLVRACIVVPLVVVLVWATISYSVWMLRPTSLSWSVNSVEWVRYNVPFGMGNWVADHVEQAYYNSQAPKKGGPQLKSLPKVGVRHPTTPTTVATAAWPPAITPVFSSPLPGEGVWQPTGPDGRWWCHRYWSRRIVPTPLPTDRGVRRLVRPYTDGARLLPGPL